MADAVHPHESLKRPLLGLLPVANRDPGKARKAAAKRASHQHGAEARTGSVEEGRHSADSIAAVIAVLQEGGQQRDGYRKALNHIRTTASLGGLLLLQVRHRLARQPTIADASHSPGCRDRAVKSHLAVGYCFATLLVSWYWPS